MLNTQQYLRSGKTLSELNQEFGIVCKHHGNLPLVILNYDQIESHPKFHPIVKECRSLVLEKDTWNLVSKSFTRFFNLGEMVEDWPLFNLKNFIVHEKVDGSLVSIFNYKGQWFANTRGSFGVDKINPNSMIQSTWHDLFCQALKINNIQELEKHLNPKLSYACEFTSLINKVIRKYPDPELHLLSVFDGVNELHWEAVDALPEVKIFNRPKRYEFNSVDDIQGFIKHQESVDPTYEGVVIRDINNYRWKIKSLAYLALSQLKGNGNIFHPRYLLPHVLAGNGDELFVYMEEVKEPYLQLEKRVLELYDEMVNVWQQHWQIESQKDFALAINNKTPFVSLLFNLRRDKGKDQTEQDLKNLWRKSTEQVTKILLKRLKLED